MYREKKALYIKTLGGFMFKLTKQAFLGDKQGKKFRRVVEDSRISFDKILLFFNDEARQIRMADSELHQDRPALAGVITELESSEWFGSFFESYDAHTTYRTRQAIGVVVRLIMEGLGWSKTGVKGSLGKRRKVITGDTTLGAYRNESGISKWFTRAERYVEKE